MLYSTQSLSQLCHSWRPSPRIPTHRLQLCTSVKASSPSPGCLQEMSIWRPLEAESRDKMKASPKSREEEETIFDEVCAQEEPFLAGMEEGLSDPECLSFCPQGATIGEREVYPFL